MTQQPVQYPDNVTPLPFRPTEVRPAGLPVPSVSRIVHYVSYGTPGGEYGRECRAAIVTEVPPTWDAESERDQPVGLAVLNPGGLFFARGCVHDEDARAGGTWHWPERV